MTSFNSPSILKSDNTGFEPQESFPVYEIDVLEEQLPKNEQRIAGFLRKLKELDIPCQGEISPKFIFQRKPLCKGKCYLLDPKEYPPSNEGIKSFVRDLKNVHTAHVGESYMIQTYRTDAKGVKNRCVISCSHGRLMHKRMAMKVRADEDAIVEGYREDTVNDSRRHSGYKVAPRRTTSILQKDCKCDLSAINIHYGINCLFIRPSEIEGIHTRHI